MIKRIALLFAVISALGVGTVATQAKSHRHHAPSQQAPQSITVWVNLDTGIYHYPGERWYGRTKNGAYMSEAQALAHSYRATRNGQ